MKKQSLKKGVMLMLTSSTLTCIGQLCWKLSGSQRPLLFVLLGFFLYGCGALLMIGALRFGELSVLHPMLSVGYALSVVLGGVVLGEEITAPKVTGIAVIILGLILLSAPEKEEGR